MRILSFDQSLTAAAAVLLNETSPGVLAVGEYFACHPSTTGIHRMMDLRVWIESCVRRSKPHMLVRELHHMRQFGAAAALQGLSVVLDMVAYEQSFLDNHHYAMIAPGTWKKFCTGKGNLKKDTAYMMHLNKFFSSTDLLITPEGDGILDDNTADAICLGITGYNARRIIGGEEVLATKTATKALENVVEKMFDYGNC